MGSLTVADVASAIGEHPEGATVRLRVMPRAPRTAFTGRHGDALKLKVQAPPVEGAANEAVRAFLAERCAVPKGDVELVSGDRSRTKVVLIRGRSTGEVALALAAA